MKRALLLALIVVAAIGVAVAVAAPSAQKAKTTSAANPAKTCKAERASIGVDAFAAKYGTNPNKRNAFGKCVSKIAKAKSGGDDAKDDQGDDKGEKSKRTRPRSAAPPRTRPRLDTGKTYKNFGACVSAQKKTS